MQEKKTIWIRLYYSLFFTITGLSFIIPSGFFIISDGAYHIIEKFLKEPIYHNLIILISLSVIAIGFTILLLKNWSRLIALFIGLLFVLSSIEYLLPRPGMSIEFKFGYLEYKIILVLWIIMVLCSTLIPLLEKRKLFRRIALFSAIIFFFFLIVFSTPSYWMQAEMIVVLPYLIFPVAKGLLILSFFTRPKIREQFK